MQKLQIFHVLWLGNFLQASYPTTPPHNNGNQPVPAVIVAAPSVQAARAAARIRHRAQHPNNVQPIPFPLMNNQALANDFNQMNIVPQQ